MSHAGRGGCARARRHPGALAQGRTAGGCGGTGTTLTTLGSADQLGTSTACGARGRAGTLGATRCRARDRRSGLAGRWCACGGLGDDRRCRAAGCRSSGTAWWRTGRWFGHRLRRGGPGRRGRGGGRAARGCTGCRFRSGLGRGLSGGLGRSSRFGSRSGGRTARGGTGRSRTSWGSGLGGLGLGPRSGGRSSRFRRSRACRGGLRRSGRRCGGGFLHRKDGFLGFGRCRSRFAAVPATFDQAANLRCLVIADGAAVALRCDRQFLGGIEHVLVLKAQVLGQLVNPDFAAAGHSVLQVVGGNTCHRAITHSEATIYLASAPD